MAPVSLAGSVRARAAAARAALAAEHAAPQSSGSRLTDWINSLLSHLSHNVLAPLGAFARTEVDLGHLYLYWMRKERAAVGNLIAWLMKGQLAWLKGYINIRANRLRASIGALRRLMIADDIYGLRLAMAYAAMLVTADRKAWVRAVRWAVSDYRTRDKWLHQNIEREAVSGYTLGQSDRLGTLTGLAGLIASYAPETRALVRILVKGILDLAAVDNPVLRITLGFIMGHIVRRLGLDKPIGDLLSRLLGSVLAGGKPKGLHDVIADISRRLAANEQQWATFMADGGAEILQAGQEWQGITALGTNAAILAFFAAATVTPHTWARDVSGTLGVAVNDTSGAVVHILGGK